jgi:alpha-1,2-mannosyltransferase
MAGLTETLRSGAWLTRERARLIAFVMLAGMLLGAGYLIVTSDGRNDRFGRPLGTDFSNVYAAGTYVLEGKPTAPFDPAQQHARERAIFGDGTPFYGWHYPPFFLLLAAPLAAMPYWLALLVWQGVTLGLYLLTVRVILLPAAPVWEKARTQSLLFALAFPAVFINLGQAHNGFLTAALLGGALCQLDRRPWLAGILFGCLAYKPQFGLLIPLVLVAGGYWRTIMAATATVAVLTLGVTFAFGVDVWRAFLASTEFTRTVVLEQGGTGWYKIQSVFAWTRMWGGSISLAYAMQGAVTIGVAAALAWLWRSRAAFALKAGALAFGCVLATPYSLDYDLMLLAPAIAYLAADGLTRGLRPYEQTVVAMLWLVPLIARAVPKATLIPLAVPLMLIAFALLLHRAMDETGRVAVANSPTHTLD